MIQLELIPPLRSPSGRQRVQSQKRTPPAMTVAAFVPSKVERLAIPPLLPASAS